MKILVFSDSHRFLSGMVQAIEEEKPDQVIHLGDLMGDAEELSWRFQTLPICMVPGNCDGWTTAPAIKRITLQGRDILLSHGHLWRVKGARLWEAWPHSPLGHTHREPAAGDGLDEPRGQLHQRGHSPLQLIKPRSVERR